MQRARTDWWLFLSILGLVSFGLVMLWSASAYVAEVKYHTSSYFIARQAAWAAIAVVLMMLFKRMDYRRLNSAAWAFGSIGIALMLLVAVYFLDGRTHRFLRLGPLGLQPSELAKPTLILFLAYFVSLRAREINDRHTLGPAAMTVGLVAGAVTIADLGTAVVLVVTAAVVFSVAGLEFRYFKMAGAVAAVFLAFAVAMEPYRLGRVISFFDPEHKVLDRLAVSAKIKDYLHGSMHTRDPGYQLRQSLVAVGSGGVLGQGLMNGKQKLFYLPEAHNDFIYAVVGEELGLVGCTLLVLVFLIILWRGARLARNALDDFGRYLALGVTTMVVVQALINMSVVLGLVPTKGIPLPMISYGGSSLLSTLVSIGMMLSVSDRSA